MRKYSLAEPVNSGRIVRLCAAAPVDEASGAGSPAAKPLSAIGPVLPMTRLPGSPAASV